MRAALSLHRDLSSVKLRAVTEGSLGEKSMDDSLYSVRVVDNSDVNRLNYPVVSFFLQNDFRAAPLSLSPEPTRVI